ncbi:MAG: hypothetical protein HQL41_12370 [Alphaproteobacteria bacterium]|nr:hypothetical protein [Alphaproteobacteria bacterium]
MIDYINDSLPQQEELGTAIRQMRRVYPETAIRELVANALIHQDFNATGTSPMIEIYDDRIEFTNYGKPLVSIDRMMDEPPRSRNEAMAGIMKGFGICEERGSGIDKVFAVIEFSQLPAPEIFTTEHHTVVRVWGKRDFSDLGANERIRACYWHACLKSVSGERMTNESLRERFGVDKKNYSAVSRVIRAAIDSGMIKPHDPTNLSKKHASYVPYWVQNAM